MGIKLPKILIIITIAMFALSPPAFGQAGADGEDTFNEVIENIIETALQAIRPAIEDIWKTRPGKEEAPTEVSVGVFVIDIANVTDVDHTFTADFALWLKWKDPRLAVDPKDRPDSRRRFNLYDIWNPRVIVVNQWGLDKQNEEIVEVDSDGTVYYRQRYQGKLTFPIELSDFPFDEHVLPIELASGQFGPEEVKFAAWKKQTGRRDTLSIVDWQIGEGTSEVKYIQVESLGRVFSGFTYQLEAKRYVGFYIWKVIFPLSMIVLMSFSVFWLDPDQLGPQIGLSTASVFALIAFQFAIGNHLPRVSYITRMDYFILGSSILVFIALGEAITTGGLAVREQKQKALKIDRWARMLFPLLFIMIITLSFWT